MSSESIAGSNPTDRESVKWKLWDAQVPEVESFSIFAQWYKNQQAEYDRTKDLFAGAKLALDASELCFDAGRIHLAHDHCAAALEILSEELLRYQQESDIPESLRSCIERYTVLVQRFTEINESEQKVNKYLS